MSDLPAVVNILFSISIVANILLIGWVAKNKYQRRRFREIIAKQYPQQTVKQNLNHMLLAEQQRFIKLAHQVAHDIQTPIMSLSMLAKACKQILPEDKRIALRTIAGDIQDIVNHLLNQYRFEENDAYVKPQEKHEVLLSATLLQIMTEKKYQYRSLPIIFSQSFSQAGSFAFVKIDANEFKRIISTLVDDAVKSVENKGIIDIKLEAQDAWVNIAIGDNGKSIDNLNINKIMHQNKVVNSSNHTDDTGSIAINPLGTRIEHLHKVQNELKNSHGILTIETGINSHGSKIKIKLPKIRTPEWIVERITLGAQDIVVILDDDSAIHDAWDMRFEEILAEAPNITIHHYRQGQDAFNFIHNLTQDQQKQVYFLTDYELLRQECNGLQLVERLKLERSILVTSHYANPLVCEYAAKTNTKMLPKILAPEVIITVDQHLDYTQAPQLKIVDLIIVDDDQTLVENMIKGIFADKVVDSYYDPVDFLSKVKQYPKNTKICLDNTFAPGAITGIEVANNLYDMGYTNLYLVSGNTFKKGSIPDYLVLIEKRNIDQLEDELSKPRNE